MSDTTGDAITDPYITSNDDSFGMVHIISGQTKSGDDYYAYVSFKPNRYDEFVKLIQTSNPYKIEDFGTILLKGYGKEPTSETRSMMEEKYGIDHNFLDNLLKDLEAKKL